MHSNCVPLMGAAQATPAAFSPEQPVTIRAHEAARRYGVGLRTLWAYASAGRLRPVKVSPRITLWRVEELDAFFGAKGGAQ